MKIQLDTKFKLAILLDAVTFSELDERVEEVKKLLGDDFKNWKIETTPTSPNPFMKLPHYYYTGDSNKDIPTNYNNSAWGDDTSSYSC